MLVCEGNSYKDSTPLIKPRRTFAVSERTLASTRRKGAGPWKETLRSRNATEAPARESNTSEVAFTTDTTLHDSRSYFLRSPARSPPSPHSNTSLSPFRLGWPGNCCISSTDSSLSLLHESRTT